MMPDFPLTFPWRFTEDPRILEYRRRLAEIRAMSAPTKPAATLGNRMKKIHALAAPVEVK